MHLERGAAARGRIRGSAPTIALEVAEAYAALFRWVDAVDVIERALAELGEADEALAARLEGELVVCGLHDARRASRVAPVLERLSLPSARGKRRRRRSLSRRAWRMVLAGRPADEAAGPLERALLRARGRARRTGTRGRRCCGASSLPSASTRSKRAWSRWWPRSTAPAARAGLVAAYSTLGLLKLRLGALPEADAAARVALRVLQEGDFAPGLAFAATVLADVAVEAGELDEAQALLALLPQEGWPAGVGTVLIPAARGRLRLAQGRPAEALADFEACAAMFSPEVWGTRDARRRLFACPRRARPRRCCDSAGARARTGGGRGRARRRQGVRSATRARDRVAHRRARAGRRARARAARQNRWPSCEARRRCSSGRIRWPS